MPNPNCRYCGKETHHPNAKTCNRKPCQAKRDKDNAKACNERRRARGLNGHYRKEDLQRQQIQTIEKVCECGRRFRTKLTWDNKPQYRYCLECRQVWRDLEAGAMF